MDLLQLLKGIDYEIIGDFRNSEINAVQFDSRKIVNSDLFAAVNGVDTDGHLFIDKAVENGADVIVCEKVESVKEKVLYIIVGNSAETLAVLAANFYGNPSSKLKLVGITGTNGKTTTATLLFDLLRRSLFL